MSAFLYRASRYLIDRMQAVFRRRNEVDHKKTRKIYKYMHHQRSTYSLRLLRRGAYHFLFNLVLGIAALSAVAYSTFYNNESWLYTSLGLLGFWILSLIVFYVKGSALRCSLCMAPLWSSRKCQKHKNAKKALGSYRLPVATSVLFKGHYRCPYCGEPFSAKKIKGAKRRGNW